VGTSDQFSNFMVAAGMGLRRHPERIDAGPLGALGSRGATALGERRFGCGLGRKGVAAARRAAYFWEDEQRRGLMSKGDVPAGALADEDQDLRAEVAELRRAVERLSRWQKVAQATLDALPDLVFARDADYRLILANTSFVSFTGVEREKLLGARDEDFLPPEVIEGFRGADRKVIETRPTVAAEEQIPLGDAVQTYSTTKFPVYGEDDTLIAIVGTARNVTERGRTESALRGSQAILQAILDGSPNIIFAKDTEGRYILANRQAAHGLSHEPHEMVGKTDYDFFPKESADFFRARDKRVIETGEPSDREEVVLRPDGERTFRTSMFPLRSDEGVAYGVCAVSSDITDSKRQEAERARLQDQVIEAQKSALREMSTPLIPLAERVVIMPLIGSIDSARAEQALDTLLRGVTQHRAEIAILDITGVSNVDAEVAAALVRAARAVELLGAQAILTGVRPEVAQTLVTLGVDLGGIVTSGSLQSGVAHALARTRAVMKR
jgi:PAS domain S-box-containing protein